LLCLRCTVFAGSRGLGLRLGLGRESGSRGVEGGLLVVGPVDGHAVGLEGRVTLLVSGDEAALGWWNKVTWLGARVEENAGSAILAVWEVSARDRLGHFCRGKISSAIALLSRLLATERRVLAPRRRERHVSSTGTVLWEEAWLGVELRPGTAHGHGLAHEGRHGVHWLRVEDGEHDGVRGEAGRGDDGAGGKKLADNVGVVVPDSQDDRSAACRHV
jgi:hypothetical protein